MDVAVANVSKKDIQEVKALLNPPKGVKDVFEAVHILRTGQVPQWNDCKKEMANPNDYITSLNALNAKRDQIQAKNIKKVATYAAREDFTPQNMKKKSAASAWLCEFVLAMIEYSTAGQ